MLGVAVLVGFGMVACAQENQDEAVLVESSAVSTAPDPALKQAQNIIANRMAHLTKAGALKAQVASLPAGDEATRKSLMAQIEAEQASFAAAIPGIAPPVLGAKGTPAPAFRAEAYQRLLAKMGSYDMTKPADAAAWAEVKKQELDQ